jgi:hypothetical protein
MAMTRPRLLASALAALLVLALGFLLFTTTRSALFTGARSAAEDLRTFDVSEPPPADMASPVSEREPAADAAASPIAVAVPRIAYTYGYTLRLGPGRIASVQERHLALCRRLGAVRCRVVSMRQGLGEGGEASGQLKLQVAAPLAEAIGPALTAISARGGGDTVDRSIAAEDLSRQMVDSAARIRTREVLIRRLTALLETRSGNIAQAVEAERAINTAQEELDAARNWLAEMQGRVAMSAMEISYVARGAPAPAQPGPIAAALAQLGALSAGSVGMMIVLVGVALPWLALGIVILLVARFVRRRRGQAPGFEPESSAIE